MKITSELKTLNFTEKKITSPGTLSNVTTPTCIQAHISYSPKQINYFIGWIVIDEEAWCQHAILFLTSVTGEASDDVHFVKFKRYAWPKL